MSSLVVSFVILNKIGQTRERLARCSKESLRDLEGSLPRYLPIKVFVGSSSLHRSLTILGRCLSASILGKSFRRYSKC